MREDGRRAVKILGKSYLSHRVAWLLQTGEWPAETIDHKDGDPLNNKWENLREASHKENGRNSKSAKNSSSKYLGVSWHKPTKKWQAQGRWEDRNFYLGLFTLEEAAAHAYDIFAKNHYNEFANLNLGGT